MPNHKKILEYTEFSSLLRKDNALVYFSTFDGLKRRFKIVNGVMSDSLGGNIKPSMFGELSKELNISKRTLQRHLHEMVKRGWAKKTKIGYLLISWKKVAELYGYSFKERHIDLSGGKTEATDTLTHCYYNSHQAKQAHSVLKKQELPKGSLNKKAKDKIRKSADCSNSVRQVQAVLGLSSPRSVTSINRRLVKKKLIKIKKRVEGLCKPENLHTFLRWDKTLLGKIFYSAKKRFVMKRLRSNIIVL
jgi:predicted transcriptional regulator